MQINLVDAFDIGRVHVKVVPKISDVEADVVVITSGVSMSSQRTNWRDMALRNREILEDIARQCAVAFPSALFIVVSNPV